jgi:hypothetical protein
MFVRSLLVLLFPVLAIAFAPHARMRPGVTDLSMVPRYDNKLNRWTPSGPEEGPGASYGPLGSLLRQGPSPFFTRIFNPDDYEQAVLKFMAGDKVDRTQAQANMDAYLRNPSDWQYNRIKGYAVDYSRLQPAQLILTLVWSSIVLSLIGRGIYCVVSGDNFWAILGLQSKVAECVEYDFCLYGEDRLTGM